MLEKLGNKRGEGYIDVAVLVLCAMIVIALAVKVFPVYIAKSQLDTFASELCREAEIAGRVGSETSMRAQVLREKTGLDPAISWSKIGKIQLNEEFTVTVSMQTDIGLLEMTNPLYSLLQSGLLNPKRKSCGFCTYQFQSWTASWICSYSIDISNYEEISPDDDRQKDQQEKTAGRQLT